MENFKPIPGFPGYEIGDKGTVVSLNYRRSGKRRELKGCLGSNKQYLMVTLSRKSEPQTIRYIHQLVAEAFIGPRPPGLVVNHIDSNPVNNRADNLEYITQKVNVSTPHCRAAMSKAKDWKKRKVAQLDGDGNVVRVFESLNQAARTLGLHSSSIWLVCSGKCKQTGGCRFAWLDG